jgi:hypothetical protein
VGRGHRGAAAHLWRALGLGQLSGALARWVARAVGQRGQDGEALWDAATGALLRTVEGRSGFIRSVAFSPDGARVLSGAATLKLWDAATGALLRT